jgi:hypothetical protein
MMRTPQILICFFTLLLILSCKKSPDKIILTPNVDFTTTKGCGDMFLVHKTDSNELLVVYILKDSILYSTDLQSFDLSESKKGLSVRLETCTDIDSRFEDHCNDVITFLGNVDNWHVLGGKLSFRVDQVPTNQSCSNDYHVEIILENAVFKRGTETKQISYLQLTGVRVGWCAG